MKLFLSFILVVTSLFATNIEVSWTAFKTPLKIGVNGKFDDVKVKGDKLENLSAEITTYSVNTNNKGRDLTLVESFFKTQKVEKIKAEVLKVEKNILTVSIEMNGIKREVPMRLKNKSKNIKAFGVIDLADFEMIPSLKSINQSCFELHSGKTWQDVEIAVKITNL